MIVHKGLEVRPFKTQAAFEKWLVAHGTVDGVWVQFAKKGSGIKSITYEQAREVALCHGWIDGLLNTWDDDYFLRRFTPRRPKSKWSKVNRDLVQALIRDGKMRPAGLAEVQAAQADGRWEAAYGSSSTIEVPNDLLAALEASPKAQAYFQTLNRTHRFAVLYRLHDAKRPETRARRLKNFLAAFEEGESGL